VADTDFTQVWFAARAVLFREGDPYQLIGPAGKYVIGFPFFYPMTAVVLPLPLGLLSAFTAVIAFVWISTAILAFATTKSDWHLLPVFLSGPFLIAALRGQWSILLSAGLLIPALALTFSAKPSIGLAYLASNPSKRTIAASATGGVVLGLIGMAFVPDWPVEWLRSLRGTAHMRVPLAHPAGLVALLALLRWRRADAKLILALACVPQTLSWYETLPLLLIAGTLRESLLLALVTSAPLVFETFFGRGDGTLEYYPSSVPVLMLFAYVPPLILVLRRPNARSSISIGTI
jgi:hypothetical protein